MRLYFVGLLTASLLLAACGKHDETHHHMESAHAPLPPGAVVHVREARIHQPLQGQDVTIAYMRLAALEPQELIGVSIAGSQARIELHTHLHSDGQMRMRRVEAVSLPAGEWVEFRSGGLHLMLFEAAELAKRQSVDLVLEFASGQRQSVPFNVSAGSRSQTFEPSDHQHH